MDWDSGAKVKRGDEFAMKFVIGDIHGEITKLKRLIFVLEKFPIEKLIFVGDYIDKGEDSKATLLFLDELSSKFRCDFLLGNHEYAWLRFIKFGEYQDFLLKYGGGTVVCDFKMDRLAPDTAEKLLYLPHQRFFDQLKKFAVSGKYFICHSGINPEFANADDWGKLPEKEFVFQRQAVIGYRGLFGGKRLIFGHTAFRRPFYDGFKIGVNTGAGMVEGAPLTAFEIDSGFFINDRGEKQNLADIDINQISDII